MKARLLDDDGKLPLTELGWNHNQDPQGNEEVIREGFSQKCEGSDPSGYEQVQTEIRSPTNLANHRGISPSRVSLEQKLAKARRIVKCLLKLAPKQIKSDFFLHDFLQNVGM